MPFSCRPPGSSISGSGLFRLAGSGDSRGGILSLGAAALPSWDEVEIGTLSLVAGVVFACFESFEDVFDMIDLAGALEDVLDCFVIELEDGVCFPGDS